MSNRATLGRSLICMVIATAAGVIVADIFPAPGRWDYTGSATGILVYFLLFFAFARKRK